MQRAMFRRCGFHWEGGYAEGLALRRDTPLLAFALPALLAAASVWAYLSDPDSAALAGVALLLSVALGVFVVWRATVCVSAHRDRLTWHTLWRSKVVHWSRIDQVNVVGGRVQVVPHGPFEPLYFRLFGVSSNDLVEEFRRLAAEGRIPGSVRFD